MVNLSFNAIDLDDYGLSILSARAESIQKTIDTIPLRRKSFSWKGRFAPRRISIDVSVTPIGGYSNLREQISDILGILSEEDDKQLIMDPYSDRYWNARLEALSGEHITPRIWKGTLDFLCADPRAFSTSLTQTNYSVDADPDIIIVTPSATAFIEPIYLFTAGEALNAITFILNNSATGETLQWEGTLANTDELKIDVGLWLVTKNDVADMADVSGQFPTLIGGANTLTITSFGTLGTLDLTYRATFL